MMDLTQKQWVKHTLLHPIEGFEDLRWKKGGSMKYALVIVVLLFVSQFVYSRLYAFQFWFEYDKLFNVVPYIVQSVVLFAVWVVGNWAVCTLLDGEGTIRNICIYSAYALIPFIAQRFISTIMSHFLVYDEHVFIQLVEMLGISWSCLLLFQAIKSVHQYSVGKTLAAIALTIVAMLIILFLGILLISLFQKLYVFVYSIYMEILYRIKT